MPIHCDFSVDVRARVLTNDPALNVRLVRAGAGLTMGDEGRIRDGAVNGELVAVLEEFSTPFPRFDLHHPQWVALVAVAARAGGVPAAREKTGGRKSVNW